jgi:hypothetical protein
MPAQDGRQAAGSADARDGVDARQDRTMIRKLPSGQFRLYSRKIDPRTLRRRNLGTFATLDEAKQHERQIQQFRRERAPP